ncbi:protection of telomeres protein 1b-like [Aristolochia californica]|uniref:protection of telomeres protein 1b-like n=1 Tax=Aristolochia californica TaxID=171875 RepID=UPI0035DBACAE
MAGRKSSGYMLVNEITSHTKKASLVGCVVEFTLPKQSKGTDYFCTLLVMDLSCQDRGLPISFFHKEKESLPHARTYGDLICIRHVTIQEHNDELCAVSNKKFSSFALFGGVSCQDLHPYQASMNYQIKDLEEELIMKMRMWLTAHQFNSGISNYLLKLREIKASQYFDLVCKVIHVREISEGWTMYVWDGTDCPSISFETNLSAENAEPPLQLEQIPLSRSVLCSFPCVGTVVIVAFDKSYEDLQLHLQPVGQWIKLRNIMCETKSGIWQGRLTPNSRLRLLADGDSMVKACQRECEERMTTNRGCLPLTSLPSPSRITVTDHDDALFSTLMDVLTDNEAISKYKCVVRFIGIIPWHLEELRSPRTGLYRMKVTLEDPTARIRAYLTDEDAEKFFGGFLSGDELKTKMHSLFGISEEQESTSRNPPWVQCCILAFYQDKNDIWGSRKYRICDTTLVG